MKIQTFTKLLVLGFISLVLSPTIFSEQIGKGNNKEFLKDIHDLEEFLKAEYSKNRKI